MEIECAGVMRMVSVMNEAKKWEEFEAVGQGWK